MQDLVHGPCVRPGLSIGSNRIQLLLKILEAAAFLSLLGAAWFFTSGAIQTWRTHHVSCQFGYSILALFIYPASLVLRNSILRNKKAENAEP